MLEDRYQQLKLAERGAIVSIIAYLLISTLKLVIGKYADSEALWADGLNNFTDIISSVAVLIGLHIARKPADEDHRYGHWKVETVASMITSLIMLLIGLQVLYFAIENILKQKTTSPEPVAAFVGIFSAVVMFGVYFYNIRLAQKVQSGGLKAAAKDNLSDALTSLGTAVAIFAASMKISWLDSAAAVVVGVLIIKTAVDIFKETSFSLSDGFDEELLQQYKKEIEEISGIKKVRAIRGRSYGANVFLDVIVLMNGDLSVRESHCITETIEQEMKEKHQVFHTEIHVEPYEAHS